MKTLGYYNGTVDELDRMSVPMLDRAGYFGDGVYDVTYTRNHIIYALEEHVDRLFRSAQQIHIHPQIGRQDLEELLRELVQRVDDGEQWVYMQFSRGTDYRNHAFPEPQIHPNLWIMLRPVKIKDTYRPLRCITMEDIRSELCNIKSLNLLPSVLATEKAVRAGVDECIFHRGDIVTECAHSNVSILQNGVLITHPADCHILAGTGRAHLLHFCRALGIPVEERTYTLRELMGADEVLLTSASALCMRITEVDGVPVGGNAPDVVRRLQDALLGDFLKKTER